MPLFVLTTLFRELSSRPAVRDYLLICGTSLGMLSVLLATFDLGMMALLPALIGLLGLLLGWSLASTVVLLLVLTQLVVRSVQFGRFGVPGLLVSPGYGVALAVTLLVYVSSQARLLTLLQHAVPPDTRRQRKVKARQWLGRWLLPGGPLRRSAESPPGAEFVRLLLGATAFGVVALVLWVPLSVEEAPAELDLSPPLWRLQVLAWLGLLVLLLASALLVYLRWSMASVEEARMRLQDVVWQSMRGESRSIWRWHTWRQLREEKRP